MVPCGQLDDVCDEGCDAQAKDVDTYTHREYIFSIVQMENN